MKTITIKDNITKEEFEKNTNPNKLGIIYNNSYLVSGIIGTNMIIGDYKIIVPGDVTGDGIVDIQDCSSVLNIFLNGSGSADTKAADLNNDGVVDIQDVSIVLNAFLSSK